MGVVAESLGLKESGAEKQAKKASKLFDELNAPVFRDFELEKQQVVGDPRDFISQLGDTELNKVDPATRDAQVGALTQLQEIASQGGLTNADRSRLEQIERQEALREKGQREAVLQNAAARGTSGSGLELASLLGAQQGAAERSAQRDLGVADLAQQRALQALQSSGQLAGQVRGQDFQAASAQDLINRFNAQAGNAAGLQAFQNQQNIANQNVSLANQQALLNQQLQQQRFDNEFDIKRARADAFNKIGQARSERTGRLTGLIGTGIEAGGAAFGRGK